jgi:D-alanyl-D-alanine-carboxypeptidase/D-alanyl-D-alanine-endopeptidase
VEAAGGASRLRDALQSAGARRGAVACRVAGSGPAICAWGPVAGTSVFEAGSVTKAVTGLLLALAIDAGEVSSSDRLDRFVPGTGPAGCATLAELATHTSGLPRLPAATLLRALAHPSDPYRGVSFPRLIRDTRRVRPGRPGRVAYSNLGVALLGHALAAAATMPYWDLARIRVLTPLRMTSSGDMPKSALVAPGEAWDLGAFAPAGGLRATVDDLLRLAWVAARPSESPFPAAAADALTPRAAMNNGCVGWCWMLGPQAHRPDAWHNGATGAGWAFIGANNSGAIAACVPASRQATWDTAALRALRSTDDLGVGTE